MLEWTRADSLRLGTEATHLALGPDQALLALEIGARIIAHGITSEELNRLVLDHYRA